ncbi:hypothetical protein fugu_010110 [Takifugu bimaculatus]|uniref:Uncharacterized protein n=1 Tax=Takifugu bimaculatus TaxID=433685 RepID=A0A4Z2CEF3_9TELE|nr:hypothetical protein fugu_010110 [Takifugu bimaculatus]
MKGVDRTCLPVSSLVTACKGFVAPEPRGGKEETQEKTTCAVSKLLFYGCQMPRLLQNHHSVQSRSNRRVVCRLLHGPLSAYGRESSAHGRMFVQEETTLSWSGAAVPDEQLSGHGVTLPLG